jgi:hypothetical protein
VSGELITKDLPKEVLDELAEAKQTLEHRGLADRLTELIGAPITATFNLLPDAAESALQGAIDKSLKIALEVAVGTLGNETSGGKPKLVAHKLMAGISGAAGGAFGLSAVALELPISTTIILRSVADIARSQGEDLALMEARLACLEVFAIDGGSGKGNSEGPEIGYFAVRAAMSKQIADASSYLLKHGLKETAGPPLVQLLAFISKRFGVVVSQKFAVQAVPLIGALGGALINSFFIDHYQDIARAHFTIRRLEREYGKAAIQEAFQSQPKRLAGA